MDFVADLASGPLFLVDINGDLSVAALSVSAAAAGYAVREMSAVLDDIQSASIRTNDALPI
jgi:hypothetical protein